MNLQYLRGGTAALANDRRQNDRAVDIAAAAATGSSSSCLENARQRLRDPKAWTGLLPWQTVQITVRLSFEMVHVDTACHQNRFGIGVVA